MSEASAWSTELTARERRNRAGAILSSIDEHTAWIEHHEREIARHIEARDKLDEQLRMETKAASVLLLSTAEYRTIFGGIEERMSKALGRASRKLRGQYCSCCSVSDPRPAVRPGEQNCGRCGHVRTEACPGLAPAWINGEATP